MSVMGMLRQSSKEEAPNSSLRNCICPNYPERDHIIFQVLFSNHSAPMEERRAY
jgi:hypothetical protein